MDKSKIILPIIIISIVIIFGLVWILGYYPIVFIKPAESGWFGWRPIFAKSLNTNYEIALNFYKSQLKGNQTFNSSSTQDEIKRAVLQSLIEDKIIETEINRKIGASEFKKLIDEKLNKLDLSIDKIKEGAKLLYGVSVEQLKNTVLTEQAKREIAADIFSSPDKNFNNWLEEKFVAAKKVILIPIKVD